MKDFKTLMMFVILPFAILPASAAELEVVPSVDLNRYAGTWYEIARLPNRFQNQCAGNVTATYTLRDDGRITVVNQCTKEDGETSRAEGIARLASEKGPSSKLEVRFAPRILSFLPWVWGDYWIIDLAPDYSYAVVGEPGRDYLWILAREPRMEESVVQQLAERAQRQGFDTDRLIRTRHD
jgi:apolipoprotein D and lipocalin family protein